jgi:Competence protein J (ComJ)
VSWVARWCKDQSSDRGLIVAVILNVEISYGQLAIFSSEIPQPFNDWTDQHVAQGFAWRPGSVSFRTMIDAGPHSIQVDVVDHIGTWHSDSVRVIEVPFEVPASAAIEIGSISETVPLTLEPGLYLLRCEFSRFVQNADASVRLTFSKKDLPRFAVLLADDVLRIQGNLLTTANAAQS